MRFAREAVPVTRVASPFSIPVLSLGLFLLAAGCGKPTADPDMMKYLDGITVRAEGKARDTVIEALGDALRLPAPALARQLYYEPTGTKREWDLKTVFQKHFVPKDLGTLAKVFHKKYDFCAALKAPEAQQRLREILDDLERR